MTDLHHRHGTNELACYGWAYDAAGRLIREAAADGTTSYQYDAGVLPGLWIGVRTEVTRSATLRGSSSVRRGASAARSGGDSLVADFASDDSRLIRDWLNRV